MPRQIEHSALAGVEERRVFQLRYRVADGVERGGGVSVLVGGDEDGAQASTLGGEQVGGHVGRGGGAGSAVDRKGYDVCCRLGFLHVDSWIAVAG